MSARKRKSEQGLSWKSFKEEWGAWFHSKAPVLLFGVKFGGLIILLYILLALPVTDRILYVYLEANAWLSNLILNLSGQHTQVCEVTIRSSTFAIAVKRGCDAVEPTWLLCAAILAFPGRFKPKLVGMGFGLVIIQLLNLVRIVTLYGIGIYFPSFFESAHLEIWPTVFILVSIIYFLAWKGWASEN